MSQGLAKTCSLEALMNQGGGSCLVQYSSSRFSEMKTQSPVFTWQGLGDWGTGKERATDSCKLTLWHFSGRGDLWKTNSLVFYKKKLVSSGSGILRGRQEGGGWSAQEKQ
jgi:hypothetical protein